ncbi:DUF4259 domain-containing protein [Streptomyces sp. NPDC058322]|uniref:DUF4259 domain-containing protein n=1 Tax=unclassified Streptomyces TaxID=2593676 RepID=UPI0036F0ED4A
MGTWDIGPFDNDTAADFGGDLDETALEEREAMIRSVLKRAAGPADFLGICDGERAVAAAALVVAQHPDGDPACSNYGPSEPLPELPAVALNRAAVAMVPGPAAGPDLPATLESGWRAAHHHRLLAVRAHLLKQLGDHEAAAHAYREAARRTSSTSERRHLASRTARLTPNRTDQQSQSANVLLVHHRRARIGRWATELHGRADLDGALLPRATSMAPDQVPVPPTDRSEARVSPCWCRGHGLLS